MVLDWRLWVRRAFGAGAGRGMAAATQPFWKYHVPELRLLDAARLVLWSLPEALSAATEPLAPSWRGADRRCPAASELATLRHGFLRLAVGTALGPAEAPAAALAAADTFAVAAAGGARATAASAAALEPPLSAAGRNGEAACGGVAAAVPGLEPLLVAALDSDDSAHVASLLCALVASLAQVHPSTRAAMWARRRGGLALLHLLSRADAALAAAALPLFALLLPCARPADGGGALSSLASAGGATGGGPGEPPLSPRRRRWPLPPPRRTLQCRP